MSTDSTRYYRALTEMGVPSDTVSAFFKWAFANLETWKRFEAEALFQAQSGRKGWGAKACAERIRFNEAGLRVAGDYRIPNQWIAYMGRIFAIKYPQYSDLFVFKEVKGVKTKNCEREAA